MDGASKFVRGDAVAGLLVVFINIVGGIIIGVAQQSLSFSEAAHTYTLLTVGDGLVTMIPSLLVSVAGGIVVTRASSDDSLGGDVGKQLFARRRPLWIAAGVMAVLALIPGLPKISFFAIAAGVAWLARRARTSPESEPGETENAAGAAAAGAQPGTATADGLESLLKLDELSLEVGYGLVPLVDVNRGGQLLPRVKSLRRHLALQLGFLIPPVHITDNLKLKPREYVIQLRGVEIARWEMQEDHLLAISSDAEPPELSGVATHEPAFGVAAKWIIPGLREQALALGYAVVDQTSVLATHLAEVIRQHAFELLSRSETKRLLEQLGESHPKLMEELVPKLLSLGEVQKVLQQLLRESVSIRDLASILESLIDVAALSKHPVTLVEAARQALGRALVRPLLADNGGLQVVTLDGEIEEELSRAFSGQAAAAGKFLEPSLVRRILESLRSLAGDQIRLASPVLLCSSPARFHLRRLLEPFLPKLVVLSPAEVPPVVQVQTMGVIR
jgi:flagellar biosynthesis protein FlhA